MVRRGRLEGWRRWRERNADVRLIEGIARPMAPDPVGRRPAVCLVTHVVAPWDGQGRVMDRLARYLVCRGIDVTLVASEVDRSLLAEAGLTWIRIPVWRRLPHLLQWLLFAILVPIRLRPSIRARFAVMHLNGAIAPIRADVNTAHFVHAAWRRVGDAPGRPALGWYQRLVAAACAAAEGRAFGTARVVVAVSGAVRRNLIRDAGVEPGRIRVVYNGVDPNEFRPRGAGEPRALRDALRLSDDNFLILFVGDAKSSRKNLDLALQALGRLPDRFVLAVIGGFRGGPYPNRAVALGVSWRTHFLGIRHDVPVCLRDADLVFCASRYEPASLVLLEAMASGVPVLSCPEVGNAVFVEQGRNGFLLRSGTDLDGAVRVIRALARDRSMGASIGREARRTAVQLSWGLMGEQYESIYRELLTQESNDSSRIRQPDPCTPALAAATERR